MRKPTPGSEITALPITGSLTLVTFFSLIIVLLMVVYFVLQPFLTTAPFPVADFVVVFIMGLVCFNPCGLFLRGVVAKGPA
jgi:hypothetical protein